MAAQPVWVCFRLFRDQLTGTEKCTKLFVVFWEFSNNFSSEFIIRLLFMLNISQYLLFLSFKIIFCGEVQKYGKQYQKITTSVKFKTIIFLSGIVE